ncbi:hypothetical protein U91I_02438 [alpha proteobacterium U9-1i]|nr:hypothetical protein U91I_02438 [alpha proteobacterium U9-1i]
MRVWRALGAALAFLAVSACSGADAPLDAAEPLLGDYLDAAAALDTIDSGVRTEFDGAGRAEWAERYNARETALREAIGAIDGGRLSSQGARRLATMRSALTLRAASAEADCADARRPGATGAQLRAALYACFSSVGGALQFERKTISRLDALGLLEDIDQPARRRAVFEAMNPLYVAINGDGGATSPYRRMVESEAAQMRANIGAAEASLGLRAGEGQRWLERALTAWRETLPYESAEPWDFRAAFGGAERAVAPCASRERLLEANAQFYRDLGVDLEALGVIVDVEGDEPVAYADFARIGRLVSGTWRPAIPRLTMVIGEAGGLGAAAELVHETGHAAHYAAIRARPSLTLPDDLTMPIEAFADVTAWSVYAPAWQHKYLGCQATEAESQRTRLAPVMLDMAWGLFEMRMADDPSRDPNAVWSEIAYRYLRVVPHPDVSWWAVRGQLVEAPGYMVNYALGAFVTADVRAKLRAEIGDFDAGNGRWYETIRPLYEPGGEQAPRDLMRRFLGRDVTPEAMLDEVSGVAN